MLPPARSVAALDQVIKDVSTSDNLLSPFAATTATGMSALRDKASGHDLFSSVGSLQYVTNEGKWKSFLVCANRAHHSPNQRPARQSFCPFTLQPRSGPLPSWRCWKCAPGKAAMRSRPTCISLCWNRLSMSPAGWPQCALMPNCVTRIAKTVPHV